MKQCGWCGCAVDERKADIDGNHQCFTDCVVALKSKVNALTDRYPNPHGDGHRNAHAHRDIHGHPHAHGYRHPDGDQHIYPAPHTDRYAHEHSHCDIYAVCDFNHHPGDYSNGHALAHVATNSDMHSGLSGVPNSDADCHVYPAPVGVLLPHCADGHERVLAVSILRAAVSAKPCPQCEGYRMRALVAEDAADKLRRELAEAQSALGSLRLENAALSKEVTALADVRDGLLATLSTVPQFARLAAEKIHKEQNQRK